MITFEQEYYAFIALYRYPYTGTYKVRNEIEMKRNETKSTKTKRNETKRNEINKNETKRNEINEMKTKQNETNESKMKSTKTKRNTMLDYFPHMSQCLSSGEDRI